MSRMLDKLRDAATASYIGPERPTRLERSIAAPQSGGKRRSVREMLSKGAVEWSPDLARITALQRRPKPDLGEVARALEPRLRSGGGAMELWPIQAWVLWEAPKVGGVLGSIGVGEGKTLIGCLLPMVMPSCERAVLFIPSSLKPQFLERDWPRYNEHWLLPNLAGGRWFVPGRPVLHVVAYSELSSPKASALLDEVQPDLVIADELQNLRYKDTARTRRFLRYFADHPETRFAGWSGTITSKSIADYAHLSALALGNDSPLPLHAPTVEEWARALDPGEARYDAGKLRIFCEPGEDVRSGFRRRFIDTQGVVATEESKLGTSLLFLERKPTTALPTSVIQAMGKLQRSPQAGGWIRPDGEELVDAMSVARCARELACGFFYRWKFPRGESEELITRWFNRRQAWNRELRQKLMLARPHLDSPALCMRAAIRFFNGGCQGCERGPMEEHRRGCEEADSHPLWQSSTWLEWAEVHKAVYHEQDAVWVSDYLLDDAVEWMREPGIVWVEHTEFGRRLAQKSKLPYYGGGDEASEGIILETGNRAIVASMKAHGTGKNLQTAFWRNLIVSMPGDAALVEQVVGRTHRQLQPRDEVEVHIYQHTAELQAALDTARGKARYIQDTTGTKQRLVYGAWTF